MSISTALFVTFAYIIIDALYALYTIYIQQKSPIKAATVGAAMYALMAFGILTFTSQPIYIIFVAIGSWIGTYFTVKYFNK